MGLCSKCGKAVYVEILTTGEKVILDAKTFDKHECKLESKNAKTKTETVSGSEIKEQYKS